MSFSKEQPLAFIDLATQRARIEAPLKQRFDAIFEHGRYIMGPEITEMEQALAAFCGAKHAIGCSSGTDALLLALLAHGVGPGDAVIVPSFTWVSTGEVVALIGATPLFVDIDEDHFLMRAEDIAPAASKARALGLKPRGVIPVDLFGQPADYEAITAAAKAEGLFVIADAAQSFGGSDGGRRVGTLAEITTTSFFPAKPLGCYGDGGAVFTDDDELAAVMRSLLNHGQGVTRDDNVRVGINGRLDTFQAAVLLEKLAIFEDELAARDAVAKRYSEALAGTAHVPPALRDGVTSAWAQYTLKVQGREALRAALGEAGIPTAVYYPVPMHQQTAYRSFPCATDSLPVCERLSGEVMSLPMHPYLSEADQSAALDKLRSA